MNNNKHKGKIVIPAGKKIWPHELRVAEILAMAGYDVEFLEEINLYRGDILLNGVEYEIKSPITSKSNSLEHVLKRALKQSSNIIIDTSRMKKSRDDNTRKFLINQIRFRKQIKHLLMITKKGQIVDITARKILTKNETSFLVK